MNDGKEYEKGMKRRASAAKNERNDEEQRRTRGGGRWGSVTSYHGISRNLFAGHGHSSTRFSYLPRR